MVLNINKDASIDRYNLEKEATNLPSVVARYHEAIMDQTRRVDGLRIRRDKEEAVARQDARRTLAADGGKPTQSMIDDAVACLPAIIHLRRELAEEERELAYLKACIGILDTKRRCLEALTSLYIRAYYDMHAEDGSFKEADVKRKASTDYEAMADLETERLNTAIGRK